MFNLIKKDLIIQKTQIILFIPLIIFLILFARDISPIFIFLVAGAYISANAYVYDGMVESNILLNSLPYTRKLIVTSRYIGAMVYMVLSMAMAGAVLYLFDYSYDMMDMAIAAGLFFIFAAIAFPLFYILKPAYIGVVMFIGMIALAIGFQPAARFLERNLITITDFITSLSTTMLYLSGAAIAIGLYLISWIISQFIYQRKVF
ncbi:MULTISPECIES: ABC-2 transporter permease [Oceanobacillus]|uniref:Permease n=1 Tax=Oceanobacillus sojae TaxID=582851 RepID=A0A511ZK60_9BACI|nr:ABC-2 transporter permease [Oceanobacillus sojae]GEN87809.1 permease [Oceanobacillus sojae]